MTENLRMENVHFHMWITNIVFWVFFFPLLYMWNSHFHRFSHETGHFHMWIKDLTCENKVNVTWVIGFFHTFNIYTCELRSFTCDRLTFASRFDRFAHVNSSLHMYKNKYYVSCEQDHYEEVICFLFTCERCEFTCSRGD